MSKSLLYMVNSASQTVAVGNTVNFGNIVRRYGCNCQSNGTTPTVSGQGYYNVDTNITLTGTAGTVILTLYQDGVAISGGSQSATIAADTTYSFSIPAIIRNRKCCDESVITLVVTGTPVVISSAAIEVVKE